MTDSQAQQIKIAALIRRKPNMTQQEFRDYHFQIHGKLSDEPSDDQLKPDRYDQIHFFDGAYGERPSGGPGPPNRNQQWFHRDDMTYLYFNDWEHIGQTFKSDYVRKTIGPDGVKFNDFETAIPMLLREADAIALGEQQKQYGDGVGGLIAIYTLVGKVQSRNGQQLHAVATPVIVGELERGSTQGITSIQPQISYISDALDIEKYFGGAQMPKVGVVYEIGLRTTSAIPHLRKAQKAWEAKLEDEMDAGASMILFGVKATVHSRELRHDPARQPDLRRL